MPEKTILDAEIRSALPVTQKLAYLNTGTSGPLPRRTADVIQQWIDRQVQDGRSDFKMFREVFFPLLDDLRTRFGRLIGANADEIALTHHTTEGMNISVWGLNWQPGDEIVTTTHEHEGGLLPVYALARRYGLTIRMVDFEDEAELLEKISAALSHRTRLVVLSHVTYTVGRVLPLREIAEIVHHHGALLAVDGAQSVGAIPVDVYGLGVDFYAFPGQKWLLGPEGVGVLFVRRSRLAELSPTFAGLLSMRDFTARDLSGYFIPASGARRFETGTVFIPGLFGMQESLRWLEEEIGFETIFSRTQDVTHQCREILAEVPKVNILTPPNHAGLTTFSVEGLNCEMAAYRLAARGIVIRSILDQTCLRVSTAFFNNEEDLIQLQHQLMPDMGALSKGK